jgi:hypothetical protein
LVDRFEAAKYGYHSRIAVSEKLAEVENLVTRFNGLNEDQKAAVLTAFSADTSGRSAEALAAFDAALKTVVDQS